MRAGRLKAPARPGPFLFLSQERFRSARQTRFFLYEFAVRVVRALDRWGHRIGEVEIRRRLPNARLRDLRELNDRPLKDIGSALE